MQTDPCLFCGEPALAWYPLRRLDRLSMTVEQRRAPLCEPHRAWLAAAAPGGREVAGGTIWFLAEP